MPRLHAGPPARQPARLPKKAANARLRAPPRRLPVRPALHLPEPALWLGPEGPDDRMYDAPIAQHQRTRGAARVTMASGPAGTRLTGLAQSGSAKAMLPKIYGDRPEVVFLNTAGGLTGGDRMAVALDLGPGAAAVATTQTAERLYRSSGGPATVTVDLSAGPGATLHWLPQETILFDGGALDRTLTVRLAGDARYLGVEMLVLGRIAMGERVRRLMLTDRRTILRDGRPIHVEPLGIGADDLAATGPAGLSGARALATVVLAAPDAADRLASLRALLDAPGVAAAASAWGQGGAARLVLRATAADPVPLRALLARALVRLGDRPLPRVWPAPLKETP